MNIINIMINSLARILSHLYSYEFGVKLRYFGDLIFSNSIRKHFKQTGKVLLVERPCLLRGLEYVEIGENFRACARLRFEVFSQIGTFYYHPSVVIGENVSINFDCHIACINKIVIGDNVLIGSKVFITDHFHGRLDSDDLLYPPNRREVYSKGPVVISDNVWVGENVAIMPNVFIGKNAIIGANSVVTRNVQANTIVGGNPARVIRSLET